MTFETGARIELMHRPDIQEFLENRELKLGFAHFAISLGTKEKVNALTERLRAGGHIIVGEPRTTGDGYYESVISDPEGNIIELTV